MGMGQKEQQARDDKFGNIFSPFLPLGFIYSQELAVVRL